MDQIQMVGYYGYYSNVSRSKRIKKEQDDLIHCILEPDGSSREHTRNWARLIQKFYEVDPLTCPKCHGRMRIISFVEDEDDDRKLLFEPVEPLAQGSGRYQPFVCF